MDQITKILTRGVDKIYPTPKDLEVFLKGKKKLRLYQGFDPTGIQMHIGHMVGLRKLAQFQKLGHHVIFLIGDGTGLAGDPSGKTRGREKFLSREELRNNAVDYVKQASKIVSFEGDNPVEILFNGDWLTKLNLEDILNIAGNFTLQQLSERDMFQERAKRVEPINLREFMYPLLQGYDSVAMNVDLEIGGSDQTFNMLCGRTLVQNILHKNKFVLTTPLLTDSTGKKIGKTEGNVIALNDSAQELYAKIMALSDDVIVKGFEYLTDISNESISDMQQKLKAGENPIVYKKLLALEIVKQLHNTQDANDAQLHFEKTFQKKVLPTDIPTVTVSNSELAAIPFLRELGAVQSNNEARRLLEGKAVEVDSNLVGVTDIIKVKDGSTVKVGKHRFYKVKIA